MAEQDTHRQSFVDTDEAPLFAIGATDEPDEPDEGGGDDLTGRGDNLRAEGVVIPFELAQYGNGQLPDELLERIGVSWHKLHPVAAAGFARLRAAAAAAGIDLTCTDSYRSYEQQVEAKRRKPAWTATPGRSVHGWGFAVDLSLGSPPRPFGARVLDWLKENGPPNGWHLGRPKDEPWHWVYRGLGEDVAAITAAAADTGKATAGSPGGAAPAAPAAPADPAAPASGLSAAEVAAITGSAEVAKGASGPGVKVVRGLLGLDVADSFDDETDAAVRAFQQAHALAVDGRVGPRTWAALRSATAPADRPELRLGSTGDAVEWVQRRLGALPDGVFGPRTEARVKAFQAARALAPDGVVGPITWAALAS